MFYHNRAHFYIQGTFLKSRSLNGKRRTLDPRGKLNPEMGRGSLQNVQKKRVYLLTKKIHPYGQIPQNWEHWVADFPYHVFFSQELLYRKKNYTLYSFYLDQIKDASFKKIWNHLLINIGRINFGVGALKTIFHRPLWHFWQAR